jgi:hypothetical protein
MRSFLDFGSDQKKERYSQMIWDKKGTHTSEVGEKEKKRGEQTTNVITKQQRERKF